MERDTYKLPPRQECVSTLSGPVCRGCLKTEFLGDNIYNTKPLNPVDVCDERHTYTDCQGKIKFTLPLDVYKDIPRQKKT